MATARKKTADNYSDAVTRRISTILACLPKSASASHRLFVEQFYRKLPAMDLEKIDPARASVVAVSAYRFAEKRKPGEVKIRIYQPTRKEHGWQSDHKVVEILNDDMPFLVDSVSLSLTQNGHDLHLVIHPQFLVRRDSSGQLE